MSSTVEKLAKCFIKWFDARLSQKHENLHERIAVLQAQHSFAKINHQRNLADRLDRRIRTLQKKLNKGR